MRNNLKEPSRPLELLVLEPEKDRFTLYSLEFKPPSELKRGLIFYWNWKNPRIRIEFSCRKKKKRRIWEEEKNFF
ncbi:hypothetical protein QVD17_42470 [Tagetes erecta]|uniref:Uncharacterized protein n=1 Tax=Tagetes erecta TaxID=13708 RepID=A0AAD8JNR6_TARER|nr:hypothetical protein QVD17_42470 [Tagetes erecta]